MVGVGVALNLQKRGRDVVLVDRRGAGEETSYGNAGLIQREAVIPYTFPREFGTILSYAMNNRRDAVYHLSALPRFAPWLFRYWREGAPERIALSAEALAPLMAACVKEHDALIAEAGGMAASLVHQRGWLSCLRTEESLRKAITEAKLLDQYGVDYAVLTGAQLRELEPHVSDAVIGAIHFRGSPTSADPGALTKAYAELFTRRGGRFLKGDARRLSQQASGWALASENGPIEAREAVIALGPWSDDVFRPLGYDIPLAVKRGYHMHYAAKGNATLGHSLHDGDGGFALVPMSKGIRLTTGVEFADRDAPAEPRATRPCRALRPRAVSAGGASRREALDGPASLPAGHGAGDRKGRAAQRAVVCLRPCPSRFHARPRHRAPHRRDDDRRDAVHRPFALCGR